MKISSLCHLSLISPWSRLGIYSLSNIAFGSTKASPNLSYETVFSEQNKRRTIEKLKTTDPVRSTKQVPLKPGYTSAAVLVPLCTVGGEPSLLYTLRSSNLKNHRGQVSFPGGNCDESDRDVTHTALRETQEELGMDSTFFDVWGLLNPLPSSQDGRRLVHSVVAHVGEIDVRQLKLAVEEVEEAFTVPIRLLCHPEHFATTRFRSHSDYTIPVYTGGAHRIWGLTAIMTHQLLTVLAPGLYKCKVRHKKRVHQQRHQDQDHLDNGKPRLKRDENKS